MSEVNVKIKGWCKNYPGERPPRFLRAFLLLFLAEGEAHGYELIEKLKDMGVKYETHEFGYVYKTLRNMEKEGLLNSRWNVKEKGAAKRIYRITDKGMANLDEWVRVLSNIKDSINSFLKAYTRIKEEKQN
ncbi:PadR family transcriptional regulator [Hippea maritima]|uniref:Transcriptional regulator, PadR-like family n=1 Tax=Hippea maritima (strain ATCC 700847 / DSM 10411 / MH2) TaxID=760142 RepID=F2LVA9_HIPMA|nr:PadR family transcriptional regulator [Hippea maritima]AEA33693.1 transcriptional regulator, PadR-like family [Hippea maritima DSM 10411]